MVLPSLGVSKVWRVGILFKEAIGDTKTVAAELRWPGPGGEQR